MTWRRNAHRVDIAHGVKIHRSTIYQRHMLQGGGEVQLSVPTVRMLPPVSLLQEGMVKRVRGVAHSMRVSPQSSNRMVGAWPFFVVTCWRAAAEPPA